MRQMCTADARQAEQGPLQRLQRAGIADVARHADAPVLRADMDFARQRRGKPIGCRLCQHGKRRIGEQTGTGYRKKCRRQRVFVHGLKGCRFRELRRDECLSDHGELGVSKRLATTVVDGSEAHLIVSKAGAIARSLRKAPDCLCYAYPALNMAEFEVSSDRST